MPWRLIRSWRLRIAEGNVLAFADLNWAGAEAEFRLAVQLAPNDGQAAFSTKLCVGGDAGTSRKPLC